MLVIGLCEHIQAAALYHEKESFSYPDGNLGTWKDLQERGKNERKLKGKYRDGAVCNSDYRSIRGYNSAHNYNNNNATNTNTNIAFRPALKHCYDRADYDLRGMESKDLRGAPFLHESVNTRTIALRELSRASVRAQRRRTHVDVRKNI